MRSTMSCSLALLLWSVTALAEERAFRIIVHAKNPVTTLDRRFLVEAFLKKQTQWPGGVVIRPVDLDSKAPARLKFCQEVLGRSLYAIQSYWQQAIFSGRDVPPPELDTDEEVIRYVQMNEGAIGYVSSKAELGGSVKALSIQ